MFDIEKARKEATKECLAGHLELLRRHHNSRTSHCGLEFGTEMRMRATQAGLASGRLAFTEIYTLVAREVACVFTTTNFRIPSRSIREESATVWHQ